MNAVSQVHGSIDKGRGSTRPDVVQGKQVKDLITKFFYRDNHLCFHILLLTEEGGTIFFQEYADYAVYKKALSDLQQAKNAYETISIPKKNSKEGTEILKVA
jgi:hypothetical protein